MNKLMKRKDKEKLKIIQKKLSYELSEELITIIKAINYSKIFTLI